MQRVLKKRHSGRALGSLLRKYRSDAGLSGQDVAARIGVTQATVSRIESGKTQAGFVYLARFATAVGLTSSESDALFSFMPEEVGVVRDVFINYDFSSSAFITKGQTDALSEEKRCKLIRLFTPSLVPGTLQTREYAQSMLRRFTRLPEDQLVAALDLRMKRRDQALQKPDRWSILVTESALRNRLADVGTMIEQLRDLKKVVSECPKLKFAIVPMAAELGTIPPQTFFIYDSHTVYTEFAHGESYLSDKAVVEKYEECFETLENAGLVQSDAIEKIDQILSDFSEMARIQSGLKPRRS